MGDNSLGGRTDLVGLVTFATWPETACPLTLSHAVLLRLLANDQTDVLRPRTVPGESHTNIGDAIVWGLRSLESAATPRKVLILLSDGEHNVTPPALTPRQAAQLAANLGVPIYVIDVGGENKRTETPTAAPPDGAETLQAVARLTGGKYFEARDSDSLLNATREIDRMERGRIESFVYRWHFDLYPWVGLAAFACWGLVFGMENTVWRRGALNLSVVRGPLSVATDKGPRTTDYPR